MATTDTNLRFGFGKNWQSYVNNVLSEPRIANATASLKQMLKVDTLRGQTFLDIGCGSGLFSLAAYQLQAERVVAFDYDQNSVNASMTTRNRSKAQPERWQIAQGSVLDKDFIATLEPADIVYSWGVLHHTGAMWQAIDNAISKVKPGGKLAIAIYNNVEKKVGGSAMWWKIKKFYNQASPSVQRAMIYAYGTNALSRQLLTGRNPLKLYGVSDGAAGRGMEFWHDIADWMGGFPYEYATAGTIFNYLHDKFGLELEYLHTGDGHGCNEFMFRRPA